LLSISLGPLISSLILFSIPAFFLGMLSPFAVKLNKKGPDDVGKQSGEVFFWSTLGSITGSFLTGFFLITYFGIDKIVIGSGIFLIIWGFFCFSFFQKLNKKIILYIIQSTCWGLIFRKTTKIISVRSNKKAYIPPYIILRRVIICHTNQKIQLK